MYYLNVLLLPCMCSTIIWNNSEASLRSPEYLRNHHFDYESSKTGRNYRHRIPCSIEWIYIIGENLLVSSPIRKLCLRMERKSGGQWSEKAEQNNQHLRHRLHDCGRRWLSADQPLMRSRCFLFYAERQWTWQKFEWLNLIDNKFDPLNLTKFDWLNFLVKCRASSRPRLRVGLKRDA